MRDRPGYRRTARAERILTQNPPESAQLAAVSAKETYRDEGVATEAPRLRAALGRGGVPRRPLQGARRSFPFRDGFFTMKIDGWVSTRSFHPVFFIGRVFSRDSSVHAKKSRVCDCRAEPPPEARSTPRSRDARRRTRPPLASSDACVGGSARRTRDRAANATRTNRLFVYAPPKPSARRRFFREYATIVSTPRVSSPAPRARYDAIRQHARSRALNTALCPS